MLDCGSRRLKLLHFKFPVLTKLLRSALVLSNVIFAKSYCLFLYLHFIIYRVAKRVLRVYGMMGFNN